MRKFVIMCLAASMAIGAMATTPKDLKDILGSIKKEAASKSSEKKGEQGKSALSNLLGSLGQKKDVTPADLEGSWKYAAPALTLKSDNALQNLGGKAAAGIAENKIAPYYQQIGLDQMQLDVDTAGGFAMKLKRATLHGVLSQDENGQLWVEFKAFSKIPMGKYEAWATLSRDGKELTLTFDISKLVTLLKSVSSLTRSKLASTAVSLLESFDGVNAGFKLTKI